MLETPAGHNVATWQAEDMSFDSETSHISDAFLGSGILRSSARVRQARTCVFALFKRALKYRNGTSLNPI